MAPSLSRGITMLLALVVLATTVLVVAGPLAGSAEARGLSCRAQSRAPMRLCGAETDNYKDCYNGPSHAGPDLRTWLAWSTLQARAASWKVVDGTPQFGTGATLKRISGRSSLPRTATLSIETVSGPVAITNIRNGPPTGRWGVLLTLTDRNALKSGPVHLRINLRAPNGTLLSSLGLRYTYDSNLFNAPSTSPEFNGPGGRWVVHRTGTKTDIEAGTVHNC